jgi:hypothetical protein
MTQARAFVLMILAGSPGPAKLVGRNVNVNAAIHGPGSAVSVLPYAPAHLVILLS